MQNAAPIRFVVAVGLACSAPLLPAQSPASQPVATTQRSNLPSGPPTTTPPQPLTPSQRPPERAQINYADGTLTISADNSSLNLILRQIAQATGIKITGGVVDERVFGQYGPAPTSQVLATLLDGTSSNMLLNDPEGNDSAELILTPRNGGPTPPNPNAAPLDDRPEPPRPVQRPAPASVENSNPRRHRPGADAAIAAPETPASPSDTTQPDSPNEVKTPQQIYDQLQHMRQQQQQQQQQTPPQ